jgi:DNA-binding NarL/FixJ family response regulator
MPTATEKTKRTKVLLADDNVRMLETVTKLIEPDYEVIATVGDGASLVEAAVRLDAEIGIIDISMPLLNGIDAVRQLKQRGSPIQIIFLTVNEDVDFVNAAFETGAIGYVVKRQMASDLPQALEAILAGKTFVSSCCAYDVDKS